MWKMKGLATFHRLPVVLFFSYLRDFYLVQDPIRFDGARCGGSLPPRRGFEQSEIVVSRIWGGSVCFGPRRVRNGVGVRDGDTVVLEDIKLGG